MKKTIFFLFIAILFSLCTKKEKLKKEETVVDVNFDSNIKSINEGDSVTFINLSTSDQNVTYEWVFIGATPSKSSQKNPTVRYNKFGNYDVKLVVISKSKKDSLISNSFVNVKAPAGKDTISVNFDSQNKSIFEDESVVFSNLTQSSDPEVSYEWTFIGGVPSKSSQKNPIVKYDKSGNYDVKLVVSSKSKRDSLIGNSFVNVKSSLTKGLLLLYPLNGNANDYSGNNINGTASSSATLTSGKSGMANTAYQFIGNANSFIQIPTEKLKLNTFSYCLWVYLDELPAFGNQYMPFAIGNTGGDQHIQAMNNVTDGYGWAFGGYNQYYPSFFKSNQKTLEAKKWYLIVVTRSNNKASLYVDCNLVAEVSSAQTVLPSYSPNQVIAKLGSRYDGTFPLKGKVDEFRIYDRALTLSDISRLCGKEPGLDDELKL